MEFHYLIINLVINYFSISPFKFLVDLFLHGYD